MLAYAFLSTGTVEPLSGFVWPRPNDGDQGPWVDADTAPSEALRGCLARDLPYWPDDELWNIELAGTLAEREHVLVAERARLLGRIDSWSDPLAWEFVGACARRAARRAAAALHEDGRADAAARLEGGPRTSGSSSWQRPPPPTTQATLEGWQDTSPTSVSMPAMRALRRVLPAWQRRCRRLPSRATSRTRADSRSGWRGSVRGRQPGSSIDSD